MRKRVKAFGTIFVVLIASLLFPMVALAVPQPPHVFYGAVTVGGAEAADGLTVTAAIVGASFPYTPSANTTGGRYGDDLLFKIPADDPDTSAKEGGVNGDTIVFYVEGVEAGTRTFAVGDVTEFDLSITALSALAAPSSVQRTTPDTDNTPTFTWDAVTNAASYQVSIDSGSFSATGNVTTYTVSSVLASGDHTFVVRAVDSQGTPGPTSSSLSFTITAAVVLPSLGGVGGGGGGLAGVTSVLYSMSQTGRFTEEITARSEDKNAVLFIPKDTVGKNRMGSLLSSISIREMAEPPAPPAETGIVGLVYDIGPDGAYFEPPITLTLKYDVSQLPAGVAEKNLVAAWWDRTSDQWLELPGSVDPAADTIEVEVSHFTAFTILARTRPASFSVADLVITPSEINTGEELSVSILVSNDGDLAGSYEVSFTVDDSLVETKEVTLSGGDSGTVSFTLTPDTAGRYTVVVNGLAGTFTVSKPMAPAAFTTGGLTITPAEVDIGESLAIAIRVTNTGDLTGTYQVALRIDGVIVAEKSVTIARNTSQSVAFTTAAAQAGVHTVDVDGLKGTFVVREKAPPAVPAPPVPPEPAPVPVPPVPAPVPAAEPVGGISWWLIGVLIAAGVVIGVVAWQVLLRRDRPFSR